MMSIFMCFVVNKDAVKGDLVTEERLDKLDGKKLDMSNSESLDLIIKNIKGKLYIGCICGWNLLSPEKKKEELKNIIGKLEDIAICYDGQIKTNVVSHYSSSFIDDCGAVAYLRKIG